MNRRDFLKTMGIGAAAVAVPKSAGQAESLSKKPNIILIMADDLGYGDLGCYGNSSVRTPNLDSLAEGGLRFTDFHSNGAVCSPTRAALLTGRYQQRCGIDGVFTARGHRHTGMALDEVTFAEQLKAAGYATALFGKWHLGYPMALNPTKQGFDEFRGYVSGNVDYHSHVDQQGYQDWWKNCELLPEKGYVTDLITKHGVRFIQENKNGPFCLYLAHEAPHYPYQGRTDEAHRRPGASGQVHGNRKDRRGAYQEMIEAMDQGIGEVVATVNRLGLKRRTFIFFCSDNGATNVGSNGLLRGGKGSLWEGGHRVPAIAYWPGKIRPGSVTGETALTMDLFATLITIGGATLPRDRPIDGVNLLPLLLEGKTLPERTSFWRYRGQKAARKGQWKLLGRADELQLYNLAEDPAETRNVAASEHQRVKRLLKELQHWEKKVAAGVQPRT